MTIVSAGVSDSLEMSMETVVEVSMETVAEASMEMVASGESFEYLSTATDSSSNWQCSPTRSKKRTSTRGIPASA